MNHDDYTNYTKPEETAPAPEPAPEPAPASGFAEFPPEAFPIGEARDLAGAVMTGTLLKNKRTNALRATYVQGYAANHYLEDGEDTGFGAGESGKGKDLKGLAACVLAECDRAEEPGYAGGGISFGLLIRLAMTVLPILMGDDE